MSAFFAGILAAISTKGGAAALSVGLAAFFLAAKKFAPGLIAKQFGKFLDQKLSIQDSVDRDLILAIVKWAENKCPDRGKGSERYELAARKVVYYFPFLAGREADLKAIIEEAVARMDEELKKRSQ